MKKSNFWTKRIVSEVVFILIFRRILQAEKGFDAGYLPSGLPHPGKCKTAVPGMSTERLCVREE